ncbi:MAG: hypothetical protein NTW11_00080 [Candidatus Staskawiczbacteria bacterium]|nr:hypothetical protein [Candidatus Staskawiczbacteria bacterium]
MSQTLLKFLVILFLFIGESFYLYSEMFVAKNSVAGSSKTFFIPAILMVIMGGILFLGSVYFGMHLFKNIWIIAVMSVAAIVIMEPLLAFVFFKQLPTIKTSIGFILGILGLIIAL